MEKRLSGSPVTALAALDWGRIDATTDTDMAR
jgi:hypothetical protein